MKVKPAGSVARPSARTARGREDVEEKEDEEDEEKLRKRNKSPSVVHNSTLSSPAKEVSAVSLMNTTFIVHYLRYKKENQTKAAKK